MDAHNALTKLAHLTPDELAHRLDRTQLTRLAGAVQVPRSGPKPALARRIIDRAQLYTRSTELGTDPTQLARTHRRDTLVDLARQWGAWRHGNKYALAAQVLGRRDQLLRSITADLEEPPTPGWTRAQRLPFPT